MLIEKTSTTLLNFDLLSVEACLLVSFFQAGTDYLFMGIAMNPFCLITKITSHTSSKAAVPLLGSTAPNVHASR